MQILLVIKNIWVRGYNKRTVIPYKNELMGTSLDNLTDESMINLTGYWCKKQLPREVYGGAYPNVDYKIPCDGYTFSRFIFNASRGLE